MNNHLQLVVKRLIDVAAAAVGLLLLVPMFVTIAIAIKLDSEGPVFFVQQRVGRRGKLFPMLKFRTMLRGAEEIGSGLYVGIDDSRITRVGRFLRRFSLDELPQLVHVLCGQMSLVGPRPALPYHLQHYSPQSMQRFLMRPGITGWSQVHGRNLISWPERLEKDLWYLENFSFALDLHILLRTAGVWLSGEGLYGARENFSFTGKDDVPMPSREGQ
jgi:lipopolysaccharide/colanic/teichoic acid biosynthesis glycosyltransferase